jgi:uncharacterized protein YbjQ (UPF0145 family)
LGRADSRHHVTFARGHAADRESCISIDRSAWLPLDNDTSATIGIENGAAMNLLRAATILLCASLAGCGTRSSASVEAPVGAVAPSAVVKAHKAPKDIAVFETDITNRKYHAVGDISVTVSKNTIFDSDPTREQVNEALQEKAAELGADAVILARYGTVGIGVWTWGKLEGNGRAIVFDQ